MIYLVIIDRLLTVTVKGASANFCLTPLPPPLDIVQILQYTLVKQLLNTLGLGSMPEAAGILGKVFT